MDNGQEARKIYIALIGSAPMASLDALILSLDRFKSILSSESAQTNFETTVRSILPSLKAVNSFVDAVYSVKDPRMAVTMKGRTLVVEVGLTKDEFLDCIHDQDIEEILTRTTAVGSLPAHKLPNQTAREYIVFPVRYEKGRFVK